MATEEGVVIRVTPDSAWVKTKRSGACESCSSRNACHTVESGKEMEVEVVNTAGAQIGDSVVIKIETASLLKASFLLNIFPIICLVIGAFIGQSLGEKYHMNQSASSACVGLIFLAVAFLIIKLVGNRLARKDEYRPRIIRIRK